MIELVSLEPGRWQVCRDGVGLALMHRVDARWVVELADSADRHRIGVLYRSNGVIRNGVTQYTWRAYLVNPIGTATAEVARGASQADAVDAVLAAVEHVTAGHPVEPPCNCGECIYRRRLFRSEDVEQVGDVYEVEIPWPPSLRAVGVGEGLLGY